MTGTEFKDLVDTYISEKEKQGKRLEYKDIAEMLGISKQNLNGKFKSKSLDSGFLKDAGEKLEFHIAYEEKGSNVGELNAHYMTTQDRLIHTQQQLINLHLEHTVILKENIELRATVAELKEQIQKLQETIGRLNRV